MEDFRYQAIARGAPELLRAGAVGRRRDHAVTGRPMAENIAEAECWNRDVIAAFDEPLKRNAGIAVLRGSLAPRGHYQTWCRQPRADAAHGRAVVFNSIEELHARIDDEALDVDENSVLVLRNCGPRGYPGMAEVGNLPMPPKLLRRGIKDMVRISDARMSGTCYGTIVLHIAPEAAAGGPLAAVREGDSITLDVPGRRIELNVAPEEIARRMQDWTPPVKPARGWEKLYVDNVNQADEGADLVQLVGGSGAGIPRKSH